jgi:hypothetical protein
MFINSHVRQQVSEWLFLSCLWADHLITTPEVTGSMMSSIYNTLKIPSVPVPSADYTRSYAGILDDGTATCEVKLPNL